MAKSPGHRPLILLRWALLGLLLVAAAAVVRVYLGGRSGEAPPPRSTGAGGDNPLDIGDAVQTADMFEYAVTEEGVTLFFIRANRMMADRQDRFVLEGVELKSEEEDGGVYTIVSDRAIYDLETRNAVLEGSVVMTGPDGIELRGESFELLNSGRVLESTAAPVGYSLPGEYDGRATGVRINIHLGTLLLRGDVAIDSAAGAEPPLGLRADRMLYREEANLLRAEGGVVLTRGSDRLTSRRLSVTFESVEETSADGKSVGAEIRGLRYVQGQWGVTGRLAMDGQGGRSGVLEFTAADMGVAFGPGGKGVELVDLEGGDRPATMVILDGAGLRRTLRAPSIRTTFADGTVSELETFLPTVFEESLARDGAKPLRRLCGNALRARVGPDGGLSDLLLEGAVDYQDGRMSASGDELRGDPEEEIQLVGEPARLISGDDDVAAPRIVYSRGEGTVRAAGGVRATGLDRSGVELATADEREPVLVTAKQATWTEEPPEVVFSGDVRAWQGESFLLAGRLRAIDGGARLEGEGKVKTVWKPRPGDEPRRSTIEVNAKEFVYVREERQLSYSGAVRAHEAGRTLRCEDLDLLLDEERRIDSLLCTGDAVVEDPVNGRTARGSEALYTPGDRLVLITGAPVVLEQRDGTAIKGRRLRYDLDSGQVRVLSEPRAPSPSAEPATPSGTAPPEEAENGPPAEPRAEAADG